MRKSSRRSGFTLPEVLVTVTIVAVLAAVMVPAVINQVAKGDSPAVSTDLGGIRTAITTFAADTRRFPGFLSELGGSSLSSSAKDILAAAFGADASAAYKGPYASITAGHVGPTGAVFSDSLFNNGSHGICMTDSTSTGNGTGTSLITPTQMALMESALDGTTTSPKNTGSVQWAETAITGGTVVTPGSVRVCLTTF